MIKGTVIRQSSTDEGTPGAMTLENGFSCDTLELKWDGNRRGTSCTKADTYHGIVWFSPMLKRLVIRYADKNDRHDCLVHNGNWAGEGEGEITQVHGCTEVGRGYGDIRRPDGEIQWGIAASGKTLDELIASLKGAAEPGGYHDVEITYRWAEGCDPEDSNA